MIFILYFVNMVYYIDKFAYVELSLCPWNEPHLIICIIIFKYYCIQFASILFMIFASVLLRDIGL